MAADDLTPGDDDEQRLKRLRREYIPKPDTSSGPMATAGIELGMIFAVLALGGWWIDRKLGTSPWLLLLGCFIGIVGGLYRLIKRSSMK
jgi:F0F1-type ATP synthase assembly protein I